MGLLDRFTFDRILSVPQDRDTDAPVAARLFAALAAAHTELDHDDAPDAAIAVAWHCPSGEERMRFLVGGRPYFPPAGPPEAAGTPRRILYPPGAQGVALDPRPVVSELASLPAWLRCPGQADPLWTPTEGGHQPRETRRGGFDDYVAHMTGPFAWLVIAQPLPAAEVDQQMLALATSIPRLRQRENSELDRVALERAQARYRELSRARASGMWRIHVLVGADDAAGARRAAALLCGAGELDGLPYTLRPGEQIMLFDQAGDDSDGAAIGTGAGHDVFHATDERRSPFIADAELLAAIARPPQRELPGIRLNEQATFDVTPEPDGPIRLGEVLDDADQPAGPFRVNTDTLNRHTFVVGATGSGKSQTVRHLLEQLHHARVPWLVIEPAKAEYAAMAGRIGDDQVTIIRPGDPHSLAVGLNPLEPEPGFPIQTHIDLVRALFLAAFEADEPFPQVLSHALVRCYTDLGWDPVLSESRLPGITPRHPTLTDLQRTAQQVVQGIGYGREISDNVRGFIDVRLSSLRLGTPGRFFAGGHPLDIAALLHTNTVLEIEDVGNDQDKAFFIGAILIRLHEHLRTRHSDNLGAVAASPPLRHVTVVEEAHRLLKRIEPGTPAAHAVELFAALLAEIRAYGEGLVIAEQIPTKITVDVIKNTALKIVHRLPAADDRQIVGAAMNLDEIQSRHVVALPPGRAAVFTDGMDHPVRITVPLGESREATPRSATPPAILRPRSTVCGPACHNRACTLREINLASRLADDPQLVLWIELLTIAHLVGRPSPRPDQRWLTDLAARADHRTLECAIGHRIQAAIDTRYTGLAAHYQPETLANHLAAAALTTLDNGTSSCDGSETEWQAGRYRWIDVFHSLRTTPDPDAGPHPDTAIWAHRGLQLPGATATEQLRQLRAHPDNWSPDPAVITGGTSENQSAYAAALARLSRVPEPRQRFLSATRFLNLTTTWPLVVLGITDVANAAAETP